MRREGAAAPPPPEEKKEKGPRSKRAHVKNEGKTFAREARVAGNGPCPELE